MYFTSNYLHSWKKYHYYHNGTPSNYLTRKNTPINQETGCETSKISPFNTQTQIQKKTKKQVENDAENSKRIRIGGKAANAEACVNFARYPLSIQCLVIFRWWILNFRNVNFAVVGARCKGLLQALCLSMSKRVLRE